MDPADIEPITEANWQIAASALCRSAMTFETMLVECLRRHPELYDDLIAPHEDEFKTHSAVVNHWRHFLEIKDGISDEIK